DEPAFHLVYEFSMGWYGYLVTGTGVVVTNPTDESVRAAAGTAKLKGIVYRGAVLGLWLGSLGK
ncbi:MAG: hypothetical protein AAB576_07750, partial [Elusimicrobiota bacterium]